MPNLRKISGFTLVEILVVMVIMGLVITAVYSLFINTQRTANTSEDVADVQQNLRVALDTIVSDIRMAGFLVPDQSAVAIAPDIIFVDTNRDGVINGTEVGDFFRITSRSSSKSYARVTGEALIAPDLGIRVEAAMAPSFRNGDTILVVRPASGAIVAGPFVINTPSGNLLPIDGYVTSGVSAGDIVVRKLAGEPEVAVISYWLRPVVGGGDNNFELIRGYLNTDTPATFVSSVIATNINALDFGYILDDGSDVPATTAFDRIRAIRIEITGETDNTRTGLPNFSGVKSRTLQTVATVRNEFGD